MNVQECYYKNSFELGLSPHYPGFLINKFPFGLFVTLRKYGNLSSKKCYFMRLVSTQISAFCHKFCQSQR